MGLALASPERTKPQNAEQKELQQAGLLEVCSVPEAEVGPRGLVQLFHPCEQGVIPLKLLGLKLQSLSKFRV